FNNPYQYIEVDSPEIMMDLTVRNDGDQPLRLLKADGGCSCRRVDQSPLSVVLEPGRGITLTVEMKPGRATGAQWAQFQFETDQGVLEVGVPYFTLISHQLDPDSISHAALIEDSEWTFEL